MEDKELAFLRVTDPEKYQEYLNQQEIKKKLNFPKLESNRVGTWNEDKQEFDYTARLYAGYTKDNFKVVEANGSYYQGSIKIRKVSRKRINNEGNFWQTYYELADGRWFDNCGLLCDKPTNTKSVDEITEE